MLWLGFGDTSGASSSKQFRPRYWGKRIIGICSPWDCPRWFCTLYVYGYGRVPIYMAVGICSPWDLLPVWLCCCYYGWLIYCLILIYVRWALRDIAMNYLIVWSVILLWYCCIVIGYDCLLGLSPLVLYPFVYMVTGEFPYAWLLGFVPIGIVPSL